MSRWRAPVLEVVGAGLLVYAFWLIFVPAAFLVAGVMLLAKAFTDDLTTGNEADEDGG